MTKNTEENKTSASDFVMFVSPRDKERIDAAMAKEGMEAPFEIRAYGFVKDGESLLVDMSKLDFSLSTERKTINVTNATKVFTLDCDRLHGGSK